MHHIKEQWQLSFHVLLYLKKHLRLLIPTIIAKLIYPLILLWLAHPLIILAQQSEPLTKTSVALAYTILFKKISFYIIFIGLLYFNNVMGALLHGLSQAAVLYWSEGKKYSLTKILFMHISNLPQIAIWCLIRSLIGGPLHLFVFIFRFLSWFKKLLVNGSWHLASYFSVLLVFVGRSPATKAYSDSRELLRNTWGEHVVIRIGTPLRNTAFILLIVFLIAPAWILQYFPITHWGITSSAVSAFLIGSLFCVESTLGNVYCTALYLYASERKVMPPFTEPELQSAFLPKYE